MQPSHKNAIEFLANWNLNLEDLTSCVRPLAPTETLLLVGSIAEGLSDALSDIDLIVIGDKSLGHDLIVRSYECEESATRLPSGQEVNFEYWNTSDLEKFAERLNYSFDILSNPTKMSKLFKFSDRECVFLHRLRTGVVLANIDVAEQWRQRLRLEILPDYLVVQNLGHHYGYREDAIARAHVGDRRAALYVLRIAMDNLAAAMLASIEITNSYPKWRTRLLELNQEELGKQEVQTLLGYLFPDINADPSETINEAVNFADTAIAEVIGRRPHLIPALLEFEEQISFVRSFNEIPA